MSRQPLDRSAIKIGEPVGEMPSRGIVGEIDDLSRQIIIGVMGLKDGESLPVHAPSNQVASRLASRQHSKAFREYGIGARMRGATAYFYKKERASEVNHQDQRLPLPPLSA